MTSPKPPRSYFRPKSTIADQDEISENLYEDPDALEVSVVDAGQSQEQEEVKAKPTPLPRIKSQLKPLYLNTDPANSSDKALNTLNRSQSKGKSLDSSRPQPFRPPPVPPGNRNNPTYNCNAIPAPKSTVKSPALNPRNKPPPLPPPRPNPPPASPHYIDRPPSSMSIQRESCTVTPQQSRRSSISSLGQRPVSPALSEGHLNYFTYQSQARAAAAQSRFKTPSFLRSNSTASSEYSLSPQPSAYLGFNPYQETEYRYYLEVFPSEHEGMDITELLRWLKRVSREPDVMYSPVFGLSVEEEIRSFHLRAMNVKTAHRLYNLLMIKRKDSLQKIIEEFNSISQTVDKVKKANKSREIAGGTTGAVGGVAAVVGIALAPMTMGVSLIATAVGAGMVAAGGGFGAQAAKANKRIVNRTTVEKLVNDYMSEVVDMEQCLQFILTVMNELRRHNIDRLQREGAHPDAVKVAKLSHTVFSNNVTISRGVSLVQPGGVTSGSLLKTFTSEMDTYFTENNNQKLKKSKKSRFSGRVCTLAKNLQEELDYLKEMWEMLC
ncbi:uncharacterized protein PAE49_023831 [Odontesthes bonariensis]|uniref:uncharacterized protein LOC142371065 n=1 Tax=Odontesthes bonariensis TaxID=219752 RepID=UPI003F58D98E